MGSAELPLVIRKDSHENIANCMDYLFVNGKNVALKPDFPSKS